MAERKVGSVVYWQDFSPVLALFRLMPQDGSPFPDYKTGQYIALRREDCKLTKKVGMQDGHPIYGPDLDENGNPKIGPVTHSYSISSAPFETKKDGFLEFYVILERDEEGHPGRLTESIFRMKPQVDDKLTYVDRITGDFTLDKRAANFRNVILVGTGTGLAPFAAMIKQLHHDAMEGQSDSRKYTLFHTNRITQELGYHQELQEIEKAQKIDFAYVASVSRPTPGDYENKQLGKARATNLLRFVFGMPLKEEEDLQRAEQGSAGVARLKTALERTVKPVLPEQFPLAELRKRFEPAEETVILTCGNPWTMEDVKYVADQNKIHFEKEDW
jgi:ferredoxin-NADP reductase